MATQSRDRGRVQELLTRLLVGQRSYSTWWSVDTRRFRSGTRFHVSSVLAGRTSPSRSEPGQTGTYRLHDGSAAHQFATAAGTMARGLTSPAPAGSGLQLDDGSTEKLTLQAEVLRRLLDSEHEPGQST